MAICQSNTASLQFDGTDNHATVPHITAYDLGTGDFTFEAWFKADPVQANYPAILSNREFTNPFSGFIFGLGTDGKPYMQLDGTNYLIGLGQDLRDNICHHYAISRIDGPSIDTLKIYIDGQFLGTALSGNKDITSTDDLMIGYDTATPSNHVFNGYIKEIRMWNIVRTHLDLEVNSFTMIDGNQPGLIGYWRLDENSGQVIGDASNNANDGYLGSSTGVDSNDPQWQSSCTLATPAVITSSYELVELFTVYPNPAASVINIVPGGFSGNNMQSRAIIYNLLGEQMMNIPIAITNNPAAIDVSLLPAGTYYINITSNEKTATIPIAKINR